MENLKFVKDIESYKIKGKIAEGCSGDEKYRRERDGKYFLLRVGDKAKAAERKDEYKCMCREFQEQVKDPDFEGYCHCMLYYKSQD